MSSFAWLAVAACGSCWNNTLDPSHPRCIPSLIDLLPKIVSEGRREATRILEGLSERTRISLQTNELVIPSKESNYLDLLSSFERDVAYGSDLASGVWRNRLIYGDNLLAMQALLAGDPETGLTGLRGAVDLIYIDPPFDSKADYRTKVTLPSGDIEQRPATLEQFAYADTWARDFGGDIGLVKGTAAYLAYLYPRLALMRELLSERGALYVHLGAQVSPYVRVILDDIFGRERYINTITWQRMYAHNDPARFGAISDYILYYSKSEARVWHPQYTPYSDKYLKMYGHVDEGSSRQYKTENTLGPGNRGVLYEWNGHTRYWRYTRENMQALHDAGLLYYTKSGFPKKKVFLDEMPGRPLQDIWTDINVVAGQAGELTGYATQKPSALIERIIRASTDEDHLVMDLFSGSGTSAAVAEKLGRRWIAVDLGKPACMVTRKRLVDQSAAPFLYQSIGDYQKEQLAATLGARYRIGDLAQVVLGLFGAIPFPPEENPNRNLGYVLESGTLVLVDSPTKLCGKATLERAQRERGTFRGGWKRVVVLAWNFVPNIGEIINAMDDSALEVLVIPPDLLDKLASKVSYKNLVQSGTVRFSSLQYLTIADPTTRPLSDDELEIGITLTNYVLLSPEALPLDEPNKERLRSTIASDPLSLVEYWSIDPDFDGRVFRSIWQDYRGNTENDDDALRVVRTAKIRVPTKAGARTVCVKAVDVFGFESEVRTVLH
ncbi:MAG TPA: site-specific DNA-methyltransferase [Thermoanaerobaculia bacterium]|nr:site-specific DNA-methyltransferase [Thermoanaerobaculia bacterium]